MAADSLNMTDDTEMAECDGDKVVTMMDVLQEQQDFEEDANAVLGASDDNNCTYPQGYMKRQAIYACLTCCPDVKTDPTKRAGVCLACSLSCHENHELVIELYTKRNFRCDCGNPKFNSNPCQFTPNKLDLNPHNAYNHNFSGLYCTCQRPYPDPESTVEDDMIQCIICEDWHHASHLEAVVPANDQYSEMICKGCMDKNEFLHDYSRFAVDYESVDVVTVNGHNDEELTSNVVTNSELNTGIVNGINVEHTEENTDKYVEDPNVTTKPIVEQNDDKVTEVEPKGIAIENGTKIMDESEDKDTSDMDNDGKIVNTDDELNNTSRLSEEPAMEAHKQSTADIANTNKADNQASNTTIPHELENLVEMSEHEKKEHEAVGIKTDDAISKLENSAKSVSDESDSNDNKPVSESNVEATSVQNKQIEKDNADAVMDAIDELLDGPKEVINNKTNEQTEGPNVDSNDTLNTDVEITTNNSAETLVDSENKSIISGQSTEDKDNVANSDNSDENKTLNVSDSTNKSDNDNPSSNDEAVTSEIANENKRKLSVDLPDETSKKAKLNNDKCIRPKGVKKVFKGATFWPVNFRQILCSCGECISMYKDLNVLFLTDPEDTITFYESLGKENVEAGASQYEKGLQALSSLNRIHQINALTEYNNMRDRLLDYLKSFKDRQEIVKEEDIRAFFAGMKPRRESDGVYFCR